jgi:hypothetical protein
MILAIKKAKYASKYRAEWSKCGLKPSKKGATYAYCPLCQVDISVAGGGKADVDRHLKTTKHVNMLQQMETQPSLSTFMADSHSRNVEDQATRAEVYFAKFVAEHNLPFLVADHFTRLVKVMFPDSKIAELYSCARTKATAIVTHALAAMREEVITVHHRSQSCVMGEMTKWTRNTLLCW